MMKKKTALIVLISMFASAFCCLDALAGVDLLSPPTVTSSSITPDAISIDGDSIVMRFLVKKFKPEEVAGVRVSVSHLKHAKGEIDAGELLGVEVKQWEFLDGTSPALSVMVAIPIKKKNIDIASLSVSGHLDFAIRMNLTDSLLSFKSSAHEVQRNGYKLRIESKINQQGERIVHIDARGQVDVCAKIVPGDSRLANHIGTVQRNDGSYKRYTFAFLKDVVYPVEFHLTEASSVKVTKVEFHR